MILRLVLVSFFPGTGFGAKIFPNVLHMVSK